MAERAVTRFIRKGFEIRLLPVRDYFTWQKVKRTGIIATPVALYAVARIFDASIGANVAAKVPGTEVSIGLGAGFGSLHLSRAAVPEYLEEKIGKKAEDDRDIILSPDFSILGIEAYAVGFVGRFPDVPERDLRYRIVQR